MPTWSEFAGGFGLKEALLLIFVVVVIVMAREERRIFRRGKNDRQEI
ncbi:MAG: hypothetical protein WC956_00895 [bacterium]